MMNDPERKKVERGAGWAVDLREYGIDLGRVAEMILDFSLDGKGTLIQWLSIITGKPIDVVDQEKEGMPAAWVIRDAPGGMGVGLSRGDPVAVTVQVGMALCGMLWPFVMGNLLDVVKQGWKRRSISRRGAMKGKKDDREGSGQIEEQLVLMLSGWRGRPVGDREAFWRWWGEEIERLWAISERVKLLEEEMDKGENGQ